MREAEIKFLVGLRDALDAMPRKKLAAGYLSRPTTDEARGECCALGCYGLAHGYSQNDLDRLGTSSLILDVVRAACGTHDHQMWELLVRTYNYNDSCAAGSRDDRRWKLVRAWVDQQLKECGYVPAHAPDPLVAAAAQAMQVGP